MIIKKIKEQNTGFSLVEVIVAIVVSAIIVGVLARFLIFGVNSYFFMDRSKEVMIDARLSVHFMNRDFRQIKQTNGILLAYPDKFRYLNYNDEQIEYEFINNKIKRNGNELADNVTSLEFRYMKSDGNYMLNPVSVDSLDNIWNIEVEFELTKGEHQRRFFVLVHPRNY